MSEPRGIWVTKPPKDTAVVFVHGILSSGERCWHNGQAYWPELLARTESMSEVGVYVFSYRADVFSAGYSLGDAVEALNAYLSLDRLLELQNVVFVCHSMGGIVVRQFLVNRQADLIEKGIKIGLFLVASPSLGSDYANLLKALARALGNSMGEALRFSDANTWLNDLDRNFINLKESNRLNLSGRELIEDEFILLPGFLHRQVVRPFSGARYFGDAIKIPRSNHFTIAAPADARAFQHRLLVEFIDHLLQASDNGSRSNVKPVSIQDRLETFKRERMRPGSAAEAGPSVGKSTSTLPPLDDLIASEVSTQVKELLQEHLVVSFSQGSELRIQPIRSILDGYYQDLLSDLLKGSNFSSAQLRVDTDATYEVLRQRLNSSNAVDRLRLLRKLEQALIDGLVLALNCAYLGEKQLLYACQTCYWYARAIRSWIISILRVEADPASPDEFGFGAVSVESPFFGDYDSVRDFYCQDLIKLDYWHPENASASYRSFFLPIDGYVGRWFREHPLPPQPLKHHYSPNDYYNFVLPQMIMQHVLLDRPMVEDWSGYMVGAS